MCGFFVNCHYYKLSSLLGNLANNRGFKLLAGFSRVQQLIGQTLKK
jgi:hypothetical protein